MFGSEHLMMALDLDMRFHSRRESIVSISLMRSPNLILLKIHHHGGYRPMPIVDMNFCMQIP